MDDHFENDHIDITRYEEDTNETMEVEIPEDEFDIISAKLLYDEIKGDTAEELYQWYLNSDE